MTSATATLHRHQRTILLWVAFLAANTVTQLAFKFGGQSLEGLDLGPQFIERALDQPAVWVAIGGYIAVFLLWMLILQDMPLSRAFTLNALVYAVIPVASLVLFSEVISAWRACGIGLIIAGVALVGKR